ncbi:MAG: cytochrome c [Chloroflexi bacterium]|nr:cytochrome c [Chloroflexota bacterium]
MHSQRNLGWRGLVSGLVFLLVAAAIGAFAATSAGAQAEGEDLARQGQAIFRQTCTACHTIGAGKLIGPDLQGVTGRREASWLRVQVQSPSVHQAQNDPVAMANFEKFRMRMPDLGLTPQQVEAVIAYLQTEETVPLARPALYVPILAIGALALAGLTLLGIRVGRKKVEVRP